MVSVARALVIAIDVATTAGMIVPASAANYYVRQTIGDDAHDGTSPERAWRHIAKLGDALHAGDTAYVGPGLYREDVSLLHDGTTEQRIILVADATGQHTGDPPGLVLIAGSDPVDEEIFVPHDLQGVWAAPLESAGGVVEMDGPQRRYARAGGEHEGDVVDGRPILELVRDTPASFHYDPVVKRLYVRTSDGRPPQAHELEILRRGNGIALPGRHHVTVQGFTIRHVVDAGINFWKTSSDGLAVDNVAWGSRQGIRVYAASDITLYRNTLFRNENSGAYFAAESYNGTAIANLAYENAKGLRWSSGSAAAVVLDNTLFDNTEAGVAIEKADRALLRRNVMAHNGRYQLLAFDVTFSSDENCFATRGPRQLVADFLYTEHYATLAAYRAGRKQDLHSRDGGCARLPEKLDVRRMHAESTAYAEEARRRLAAAARQSAR